MSMRVNLAAMVIIAAAFSSNPMPASAGGAARAAEPVVSADFDRRAWAIELADLGRERRDAFMVIAAIRVLDGLELADSSADNPWGRTALLDLAASLAIGQPEILAEVQRLRGEVSRGSLSGPRVQDGIIAPGDVQPFEFTFAGREVASVEVRLKPGSDGAGVQFQIEDARRHTIGGVTTVNGRAARRDWQPAKCGVFRVLVRNVGQTPAAFVLTTTPSYSGAAACTSIGKGR